MQEDYNYLKKLLNENETIYENRFMNIPDTIRMGANIEVVDKKVVQKNRCTMCYRCINHCPRQAMTLLGKAVVEQSVIEKYL